MTDYLTAIFITALATATVSLTVTRSKLFLPFRLRVARFSPWFGDLVSCPYCFSHWAALGAVIFEPWMPWTDWGGFIVTVLAVVALSAPMQWAMYQAIAHIPKSQAEAADEKDSYENEDEIEDENAENIYQKDLKEPRYY